MIQTARTSRGDAVLMLLGIVAVVLVWWEPHWAPAGIITAIGIVVLPGRAASLWLHINDAWEKLALIIVLGATVLVVVSLLMVWTRVWHPREAAIIVVAISVAILGIAVFGTPNRTRDSIGPGTSA